MSDDSKKFTLDEKTKIALKAASGDKGTLKNLALKHNVSEEEIKKWMHETGVVNVSSPEVEDEESVSVLATEEFANEYEFGASPDKLNYNTLFFWSAFGTTVIVLFIVAIFFVYEYTFQGVGQQSAERSQFYEIEQKMERDNAHLNSFGVVDLDEGIYRMPIDSAISRIVQDSE